MTGRAAAGSTETSIGCGEIKSLDQRFLEHFTDMDFSRVDARLRTATIADLLTMRSGIEWHDREPGVSWCPSFSSSA
jgi:hypothetical protein